MSVISTISDQWARSTKLTRIAAISYAIPIAVWGICASESALRCALRALHTLVSLNQPSFQYRSERAKIHGTNTWATVLLTGISFIPILGTVASYSEIFKMVGSHTYNTLRIRQMHLQTKAHVANDLYRELISAWEPDLDRLMAFAIQAPPSKEAIRRTADNLKASLVDHIFTYKCVFHLIDGGCKMLRIVAIRVCRLISALFSGLLFRALVHALRAMKEGAKQEVQYVCKLVDQPYRANASDKPLPEIYFDVVNDVLNKCKSPEEIERLRLRFVKQPIFRPFATSNELTCLRKDGTLPYGAPDNYFHMLREVPKACRYYSNNLNARVLQGVLKYFTPILPYIDNFKREWVAPMTPQARCNFLWCIFKLLPNLQEAAFDMTGIDPTCQLLIAAQLAKHSPQIRKVHLHNCDSRVEQIFRHFVPRNLEIIKPNN